MNPYFWLFALCALLSTPVSVLVAVDKDRRWRWRVRMHAAGIPFRRWPEDAQKVQPPDQEKGSFGDLILMLHRTGAVAKLRRALRMEALYAHVRISFRDAAQTALVFGLLRTLVQSFSACRKARPCISGRLEADFHGEGTQVLLRCIFVSRLGSLGLAAMRIVLAARREGIKLAPTEEEKHAASH